MKIKIQQLKDSNDFLNILLENIVSAIFIVDKNIKVQSINESFKILFNAREDNILGKLCGNAIGCTYAAGLKIDCGTSEYCSQCQLRNSLLHSFTEHVPVFREILERDFLINDKYEKKIFQYSTRYIQFNAEEYVLIIVDDITDLVHQQKKLEEQNQRLADLLKQNKELLGIAAHDLRNPIGAAYTFSTMITSNRKQSNIEELKDYGKYIKDSTQYALNLLDELLDISTIEAGQLVLNKTKANYNDYIKKIVKLNHIIAEEKQISLEIKIQEEPIFIDIDEIKISQVINNLISNAIKFSHKNTNITVEVKTKEKTLITKVKDQGQGIPADAIPKLFTPFQTTEIRPTGGEKSTGLGLAISKKIIEGHKGTIHVKSEPNVGSVFYFELPYQTEE